MVFDPYLNCTGGSALLSAGHDSDQESGYFWATVRAVLIFMLFAETSLARTACPVIEVVLLLLLILKKTHI